MINRTIIAAVVGCCLFIVGCAGGNTDAANSTYTVAVVDSQSLTLTESYPATIRGRQDIAILPQVSGTITGLCVKEGQRVTRGQTLFVIDQVPFKAALQMADANVEAAEAGVATAQLVYDSRKALFDEKVVSDFDLQTAHNQLLTAKASLAQAVAQQVTAHNNFSYTTVKSPTNGVVGTLPYRVGALVSPSIPQPLTTVSDNSEMYVYFSLGENRLLQLSEQHGSMQEVLNSIPQVTLKLNDGSTYATQGRIESISGVIDPSTGSVQVRAVFDNRGGLLHSGASGCVLIPSLVRSAIVIPRSATFEVQDMKYVYRVVGGKASSTLIGVTPIEGGQKYIVTTGVSVGDTVVMQGVGMLREGAPVHSTTLTKEE